MAKNKSTVYLGYEDEEITEKHLSQLNSLVNKIGGLPDWPSSDIKIPACSVCGTARALISQIYAPLEKSQFHRTLYIFACLNPACSQSSKSWTCVRTQHLETADIFGKSSITTTACNNGGGGGNVDVSGTGAVNKSKKKKPGKQHHALANNQKISWCSGADDWGDSSSNTRLFMKDGTEIMDTGADEDLDEQNEENGNVISKNDNSPTRMMMLSRHTTARCSEGEDDEDFEDEEDDSNSMENDLICGFGQLDMHLANNQAEEDPNANCAAAVLGAVAGAASGGNSDANPMGLGATATICAEIEGAETDVVLVETPQKPERDLIALLKHTSVPVALGPLAKITDVTLKPFFIAVDIEAQQKQQSFDHFSGSLSADHIRELYQEYKKQDEATHSPGCAPGGSGGNGINSASGNDSQEVYEKVLPAHGDFIFHQFLSTLQQNPGQILRYSRDAYPLLISPLIEPIPKCPNCNGETICELQILSTLIPKLRLQQNNEPAPIEYGNVLVYTCLKSCWDTPDKMRYERVIVQAEK